MQPSNQYNWIEDLIYHVWWYIILAVSVGIVLVTVYGCATRPDIMKQKKDCVAFKTQGFKGYLCLDVGGDAKDRINR